MGPIMSCVMKDPVRLPSSGVVVERSTIARHLLSDQSDPFNRAPLTMDMVEPEVQLKDRVEKWIKARRSGEDVGVEAVKNEVVGVEAAKEDVEPEKKKEKLEEVNSEPPADVKVQDSSGGFDLD